MLLYRAAAALSLLVTLGFAHIQSRSRITDKKAADLPSQTEHQRGQSQLHLQRKDDNDYVTEKEFNQTVQGFTNQITRINNNVADLQKKYSELSTDVSNDVTKDEFIKQGGVWQSEINVLITNVSNLARKYDDLNSKLGKDHCADASCENQGICVNRLDDYACVCKPGYGGVRCEHVEGWEVSAIIKVDNGGAWGTWARVAMCQRGSFARGFRIQLEEHLDWDDSSMNNIDLICHDPVQNRDRFLIRSGESKFGTFQSWQYCPDGEFLTAFKLKVEKPQGGDDDTAANGITMTCTGGSTMTGPSNPWGMYGSTAECPEGHAICGLSTKIEGDQGDGDDTGLNDVIMICCSWW